MANDFAHMAAQDSAHLNQIGASYIVPELKGRAADLHSGLQTLDQIKPVLDSLYLVKSLLLRGGASLVYGQSNVGKSFLALYIALHVAAQRECLGLKVAGMDGSGGAGAVIYVAAEGGTGMHNRIEAIRIEMPELLKFADFMLLPTGLDLCGPMDGEALADAILREKAHVGLIVIDTLARSIGDGDENTAKDMGAFISSVDHLRERTGAHVMIIHHSGKDTTKGARGSGSLRAAVDTEIELSRSGPVVTAEMRKQRDLPCGEPFGFTLRGVVIGQDSDGDEITSAVVESAEPVKKVPKLSGQQKIAMQAFEDAIAHHGEKRQGSSLPSGRQSVTLEQWREFCNSHSLSSGASDGAQRKAFIAVKAALQDKELVRISDGFVWRCEK
jgi:hypothetical protein